MVEGVGVSDEQLDGPMSERSLAAWEQFLSVPREVGMNSRTALALIGEVRASHAREAVLRRQVEDARSDGYDAGYDAGYDSGYENRSLND